MSKELKAVIFDLDGVITDTAEYHFVAWSTLAKQLNIPFSREFNEHLKGVSRMESLDKILIYGNKEHEFTAEQKAELAKKKNEIYQSLIGSITPMDILPGIQTLIADIKKHNIKLALASVSKNAEVVMKSLKLKNQFDVIVDPSIIPKGKPDPAIFLKAAELLNVDTTMCIGIEDAVAGIEAIKAAGMYAVGIGDISVLNKADLVYRSTDLLSLDNLLLNFEKFK